MKKEKNFVYLEGMCPSHKPNFSVEWAESQIKKGIKQTKCPKCKRWFFPSEI